MTRPVPRWLPFAILIAVLGITITVDELDYLLSFGGGETLVAAALAATVSIVAGSTYRTRRDPALLYIAIGSALVAVINSLIWPIYGWVLWNVDVADPLGDINPTLRVFRAWDLGRLSAWVAMGACLALITPWRDRRGRRPVDPWRAILIVAGPVIVVTLSAYAVASDSRSAAEPFVIESLVLASATSILGGIAAVRSTRASSNEALHRWVAAAAAAFALMGVTQWIWTAVFGRGWFLSTLPEWFDTYRLELVLTETAMLFLLLGVLASNKQEASRQRRATDRASEVMEGRAEIAATIAHDVRGPVGTIKGLATTTRKSYDRLGDPERIEFIGMIEQESGRLLRLVDQVAMGLKIDAGALDLHRRVQDVGPMLVHARTQVETTRTVAIDVPDGLEAPIDTRWYSEAVAQGIDNALRFSPPDSSVAVHARREGTDVVVDITDDGPGIPEEQREALFEKFSRWRPTGYDDRTGTGLGLFICRGIARTHGGDATLGDAPGGGTMLRIRVPAEQERGT